MRMLRPRSGGMLRAVLMAWTSALVRAACVAGVGEQGLGFCEGGVGKGYDQVGWSEGVVGQRLPGLAHLVDDGSQRGGEGGFVTAVDGAHQRGIQPLQRAPLGLGNLVLTLAQDRKSVV